MAHMQIFLFMIDCYETQTLVSVGQTQVIFSTQIPLLYFQ